jgi:hypothetical protein
MPNTGVAPIYTIQDASIIGIMTADLNYGVPEMGKDARK